jgi:predicted peroxiredoxin
LSGNLPPRNTACVKALAALDKKAWFSDGHSTNLLNTGRKMPLILLRRFAMKTLCSTLILTALFIWADNALAEQGKGLNVIVTSADRQAQMMAMVLSVQTIKEHGKEVHMVLCGAAGDLALQSTTTKTFLPPQKSPTMLLNALLKMGASVQICPLYLPNAGKTTNDLLEGITVAQPPAVAGRLLDKDYQNLTF